MPTNYPTSLDNFTNPTANDSLNLPSHSTQHANANDAIEAIEAKLGLGANVMPYAFSAGIVTAVSGGNSTTFPVGRFTQPPIMVVQRSTARGGFQNAESITSSGFIAYSFDYTGTGNTATNTNWIAIQMTAGTASG